MTSGTLSQMDLRFTCETDGRATVLATYCMKEAWDTIKIVDLAVMVVLFVILIQNVFIRFIHWVPICLFNLPNNDKRPFCTTYSIIFRKGISPL